MVTNVELKIDWKKANSLELSKRAEYFDNLAEKIAKASENASDIKRVMAGSQECYISEKYEELFSICYNEVDISRVLAKKIEGKTLEERMEYFNTLAKKIAKMPKENAVEVPYGKRYCMVDAKYAGLFVACYREFIKAKEQLKEQSKPTVTIDYDKVATLTAEKRADYYANLLSDISKAELRSDAELVTIDGVSQTVNKNDKDVFVQCYKGFKNAKREYEKEVENKLKKKILSAINEKVNGIKDNKEKMDFYLNLLTAIVSKKEKKNCVARSIGSSSYMIDGADTDIFDMAVKGYGEAKYLYAKERHQMSVHHDNEVDKTKAKLVSIEEKTKIDKDNIKEFKVKSLLVNKKKFKSFVAGVAGIVGLIVVTAAGLKVTKNIFTKNNNPKNIALEAEALEESETFNNNQISHRSYEMAAMAEDSNISYNTLMKDIVNPVQNDKPLEAILENQGVYIGDELQIPEALENTTENYSESEDIIIYQNTEENSSDYLQDNTNLNNENEEKDIDESDELDNSSKDEEKLDNDDKKLEEIKDDEEKIEDEDSKLEHDGESDVEPGNESEKEGIDDDSKEKDENESYEEIGDGSEKENEDKFKEEIDNQPKNDSESETILVTGKDEEIIAEIDPSEFEFIDTYEVISERVNKIAELPEEKIIKEYLNADKGNEEICWGYHLTTGNTIYDMSLSQAAACMSVCQAEDNDTYSSAVAVFSGFANRLEDGRYGYANNFYDIISHEGQYSTWNETKAANYSIDQAPDYLVKAFYDVFYVGIRNVDTVEFRAAKYTADNRFQTVAGDNNHFKLAQHVDRADQPSQVVTLTMR